MKDTILNAPRDCSEYQFRLYVHIFIFTVDFSISVATCLFLAKLFYLFGKKRLIARVEVELIKTHSNGKRIFEIVFNVKKTDQIEFQRILIYF